MGNGEAKELICTTYGHELSRVVEGNTGRNASTWAEGNKGEKKMGQL